MNHRSLALALILLVFATPTLGQAPTKTVPASKTTSFTPKLHHPNLAGIKLFAENPEIVTPVGIAVAPDGRVFVQENHTHKRTSSYTGPKT
ncbi:MAG: cytochrome C, partial [Planctomycetota bacterium]